jgi:hypothetical protein
MRTLYRFLSLFWLAKAVTRGPGAVIRNRARREAHRAVRKVI